MRPQAVRDVVGAQDGDLARVLETGRAHQTDVGPADRQDARAAPRRGCDRPDSLRAEPVPRQERREMRLDAHRSDPRPAAAVRDAEGLVQVEVRHVAAEPARPAEADHRVHVGAVDVHLSAVAVDDVADLAHRFLEHAVRRRIGDHRCGEARSMLPGLAPEIREIDVAVLVALHHDNLHAGHLRARRVRAVRRARDQAHVAFALAAARVIGADREQPGVLALRARVRLQRDGVVPGACGQHLRQLAEQLARSLRPAPAGRTGGSRRTRAT